MNTGSTLAGRPSLGSWVTYGLGTENQNLPAFVVMQDNPRSQVAGGPRNWGTGFMPAVYQGTPVRGGRRADRQPATPPSVGEAAAAGQARLSGPAQPASRRAPRFGPDRAGRPDRRATSWRSGCRPRPRRRSTSRERDRRDAVSLRTRREGDGHFGRLLPAGPTPGRARGSVRAALLRRRQQVGRAQRHREQPRAGLPGDGQAGRRPAQGPEAARAARPDAGRLGRRVRPHADVREGERPRPQPLRLHHVDGRRRRAGRAARRERPTRSACTRSKTGCTSTTSTPRSSTPWAPTTPG